MKNKILSAVGTFMFTLFALSQFVSCGSTDPADSASPTPSPSASPSPSPSAVAVVLTSATTGLKNSPDVSPAALDTASSAASGVSVFSGSNRRESWEGSAAGGYGTTLDIEVVSAPITDGMSYTMKQCANDSQSHHVKMTAVNDSGKIKYTKTETKSSSFDGNMNISSTVYTDADGNPTGSRESTIRSDKPFDFYGKFASDGTTNTFVGTDGTNHVTAAWSTTLGCAKVGSSGSSVAFALSVSSTGTRTCATSTDTSLCASMPTMVTSVPAFATFTGDEVYSCQKATGCTVVTPASAISLEDKGGAYCEEMSGAKAYWKTATTTPTCTDATTASGVCACLWPLYAAAAQKVKASARSGECKVKGLVNNGDFDLGTDLSTSKTVCIENLSIGGR